MRKLLLVFFVITLQIGLKAHPGIGIVKDSKGNIFYTDLRQVWKITPDGRRRIAIAGVHTHELFIDANDELYGENMWYTGEKDNRFLHFVWCLRTNGKLDTIVQPTQAFVDHYSFVRDGKGNNYWTETFKTTKFKKKGADGDILTIAVGDFKNIRWLYVTAGGVLYFINFQNLYKIETSSAPVLVAEDLGKNGDTGSDKDHYLAGIWADKEENIYVADFTGHVVKRITKEGMIRKIAFSPSPWSPAGGLFDDHGNLWLIEYSPQNDVQVRMISVSSLREGTAASKLFYKNILPGILLISSAGITVFFFVFATRTRKKMLMNIIL